MKTGAVHLRAEKTTFEVLVCPKGELKTGK